VIAQLPQFDFDSAPRARVCDRCATGPEGDLRFVILRGRERYIGRTLCDTCAEQVLELLLEAQPDDHARPLK
jgi:superfamily II helicase